MAFLSKEDLHATAEAYGIDLTGLKFAQQQGKVSKYIAENKLPVVHGEQPNTVERPQNFEDAFKELREQFGMDDSYTVVQRTPEKREPQSFKVEIPQVPVLVKHATNRIQLDDGDVPVQPLINEQLKNKRLVYSPEIRYRNKVIYRYEEDLGEDLEVEELWYNGETLDKKNIQASPGESNGISGTYAVNTKPGSKVIAISSIPQTNVGIYWDFDEDGLPKTPFPIATYEGRQGYLYSHATIPNVLTELRRSGHYTEFKEYLADEPNIFYLGGTIRAVDIDFCHWMMHEIEEREAFKNGRRA